VVVHIFLTFTTVILNHFAEGSQIQTYEFLESRTKKFTTRQLTRLVLLHKRSLLHKISEVLLKDTAHPKWSFPSKYSDIKLLQSMHFA